MRPSVIICEAIFSAFIGSTSKRAPSSVKVILLYNLLAAKRLCSVTARSKIEEPIKIKDRIEESQRGQQRYL